MKARKLRLTTALGLCLGLNLSLALPAWAQDNTAPQTEKTSPQTTQTETAADAPLIGDPGAYLAARSAEIMGDFRAASGWFVQAHLADPTNPKIIDGAIFALLNMGDLAKAAELAQKLIALPETDGPSQLSEYALMSHQALVEDYEGLIQAGEAGRKTAPLLDTLAVAWADMGAGRMSEALAEFDKLGKQRGFEAHAFYHKALALALAGDFEGADAILSGKAYGALALDRRGVLAHAQIMSQLERNDDALKLLERAFGTEPAPVVDDLRAKLRAGGPVPFDAVRNARDGIAEVFFSVAVLLSAEADPAYTLMNARIASTLRPDHNEALLLTAAMLENLGQFDLAVETYARFASDHPAFYSAELGRVDALYRAGDKEGAVNALQALAARYPDMIVVQSALGDLLRREERWAEALPAYERAVALLSGREPGAWVLYFSRAIAKERLKDYDAADLDFRKALELNPKQPQVLNYLGYSMLERRKNLDEALSLIEAAVKAEPDAGYIIDSLAWAYFELGRYEDALEPMERASVLEPVDPVVTDHLGDVYWMNGRQREAEFQWHRALSFGPDEATAERIRRKLDMGLDAVLANEAKAGNGTAPGQ